LKHYCRCSLTHLRKTCEGSQVGVKMVDSLRMLLASKPVEERHVLQVIATEAFHGEEHTNQRVAYLQEVVAAVLWGNRRNPVGHHIVGKRIIEPFQDFMAGRADILTETA